MIKNFNYRFTQLKFSISFIALIVFVFIFGFTGRLYSQELESFTSILIVTGLILFVLNYSQTLINIYKFNNINKKYFVTNCIEIFLWTISISFIVISLYVFSSASFLDGDFRGSWFPHTSMVTLIFLSVGSVIMFFTNFITGWLNLFYNNKFSVQQIKNFGILFVIFYILILGFTFMPVIQSIIYSPQTDLQQNAIDNNVQEFDYIMSSNEFNGVIGSNDLSPPTDYKLAYYEIFDGPYTISMYSNTSLNKINNFDNPMVIKDNNDIDARTKLISEVEDNKIVENKRLKYTNNNSKSYMYEYAYKNESYTYTASDYLDSYNTQYNYDVDSESIDNIDFDVFRTENMITTEPRIYNNVTYADTKFTTEHLIFTGVKEYYGEEVLVYERVWNFDDSKIYIHKETGLVLKSSANTLEEDVFKVAPYNEDITEPSFVENFDGNTSTYADIFA